MTAGLVESGQQPDHSHLLLWGKLKLAPLIRPVQQQAAMLLQPLWQHAEPSVHRVEAWADQHLTSYRPWQIAMGSILATLVLMWAWQACMALWADVREKGGQSVPISQTCM